MVLARQTKKGLIMDGMMVQLSVLNPKQREVLDYMTTVVDAMWFIGPQDGDGTVRLLADVPSNGRDGVHLRQIFVELYPDGRYQATQADVLMPTPFTEF